MNDYAALDHPAETPAVRELLEQAFNILPSRWDELFTRIGAENMRVVRGQEGVRAALCVYPCGVFLGGRSQPADAVALVGVLPETRRQGAARALMTGHLREAREAGKALSLLYASTAQLYRSVGYAECATRTDNRMPLAELSGLTPDRELALTRVPVDFAAPIDERIARVHRRFMRDHTGPLDRSAHIWYRLLKRWDEGVVRAYLVGDPADPSGYVIYTQTDQGCQWGYRLTVLDWAALNGAAARRLWTWCQDHRSMAHAVSWRGPPVDPMIAILPEPAAVTVVDRNPMLARVTDVVAAFQGRGYEPAVSTTFSLQVKDTEIPQNAGAYRVVVEGGSAQVERLAQPAPDALSLAVRDLAPLLTGWISPRQLALTGRLAGSPEALGAASHALATSNPPWTPDAF